MIIIPPLDITPAMITSTAVEDANTYSPGATYGLGDYAGVYQSADGFVWVYQSLQAGNVGNTPASSPLWWKFRSITSTKFSLAGTFAINQVVYDPVTHQEYRSLVGSNFNNPLSDATKWEDLKSVTNYWAALDLSRNTATTVVGELTKVIQPGRRFDSITLVGLSGTNFMITVSTAIGGGVVLSDSGIIPEREIASWMDWISVPFEDRDSITYLGIQGNTDSIITITITSDEECSLAGIVIGRAVQIGQIEFSPVSESSNFTRVNRNAETGKTSTTKRLNTNKSVQTVWTPKELVRKSFQLRDQLDGAPAMFLGIDDKDQEYYMPLAVLGVASRWLIDMAYKNDAKQTIEVSEIK